MDGVDPLGNMSDIAVPRTPTPASRASKSAFASPPPRASQDLTPPPSIQIPKFGQPLGSQESEATQDRGFSSPPASSKATPIAQRSSWKGRFPSVHETAGLSNAEIRELVEDLLPAFGEARMTLAHTQLQLSLLKIEAEEAAQRAEVEHDLTRREIEVLQAGSPLARQHTPLFDDQPPAAGVAALAHLQRSLDAAVRHAQELGTDNTRLRQRLKQAKRLIKHLDGTSARLAEDNALLRERIRQNREHRDAWRSSPSGGAASVQSTPGRAHLRSSHRAHGHSKSLQPALAPKAAAGPAGSQNALDALLMADQILSADATSVPSTPSPYPPPAGGGAARTAHGHVRGTQSLSSLPSTPRRGRPGPRDAFQTPVNQIVAPPAGAPFTAPPAARAAAAVMAEPRARARPDRDSTISASSGDEDAARTDDDLPASQASRAASGMLRRRPGGGGVAAEGDGSAVESSQRRLVQARLAGKITKSSFGKGAREHKGMGGGAASDSDEGRRSRKRARTDRSEESLGLGIGIWGSPR